MNKKYFYCGLIFINVFSIEKNKHKKPSTISFKTLNGKVVYIPQHMSEFFPPTSTENNQKQSKIRMSSEMLLFYEEYINKNQASTMLGYSPNPGEIYKLELLLASCKKAGFPAHSQKMLSSHINYLKTLFSNPTPYKKQKYLTPAPLKTFCQVDSQTEKIQDEIESDIELLFIQGKSITKIAENTFFKCRNLKIVYIHNNNLCLLPPKLLEKNFSSNNNLSNIPQGFFKKCKKLVFIDLENNDLQLTDLLELPCSTKYLFLKGNKKLYEYNKLSLLEKIRKKLPKLEILDI